MQSPTELELQPLQLLQSILEPGQLERILGAGAVAACSWSYSSGRTESSNGWVTVRRARGFGGAVSGTGETETPGRQLAGGQLLGQCGAE